MPAARDPLHPRGGLRLLRPQRRRRRRARRGAAGARGARPPGAAAMDARRRVRLGAVRPRHGDARQGGAWRRRQDRRLAIRGVEQHPFDAAGIDRRHQCARGLVSRRAAEDGTAARARRSRPAAAIATPSRSTISRASGWSIISSRTCRSGSRRCARSAPMPTCSRSNPSWTSSRPRPAPIRSRSALRI